ncbi:putative globin-like protein [Neofusicoccum parvum UCRNP2]|uniref:Putative globin-like protein n=1 Tax=Botryosphaeria parva (strain UCR-NP2) TaxID=1287680 RepID=R1G831_BOTPV|nr:putative globin-like protein [Neofusicoccum parvum UCRNP2]
MAPPGLYQRPIQHIDRKDLYTNLEARIQYLHTFLDFSSTASAARSRNARVLQLPEPVQWLTCKFRVQKGDIEALQTGHKYIKALIPAIVNIVYKKLLQYDITARAFETRSTSFEGPMDAVPDENSPQIIHRKMFLRAYLVRLCSDPSKMEFWEYLDKVGMMHVGRGRQHPLHVEYMHIGALLSFIQDVLNEAILSHPRLHMNRKIALVKALGKVIWIQNDLFAKWYVRDGDEFAEQIEDIIIEREGYLHGKKIIGTSDESDVESTTSGSTQATGQGAPPAGVCPFTGVQRGMEGLKVGEGSASSKPSGEEAAPPQ